MARGDEEKDCFDHVKYVLFTQEALNYCYETFCKDRTMLTRRPTSKFYALTERDIEIVEDIFFKAIPNDNLSEFPDFISDDGFVEHFQISSSQTTKAGAGYKRAFSQHEKEFEKEVKCLQDEMSEKPSFGEIRTIERGFSYGEGHSHDNLIASLKQCVNKHIHSEESYKGNKTTKIFMIEYNELSLMTRVVYPDVKLERAYGDLLRREGTTEYRLSRDKEALSFLYEKHEYIDYVVFATDFDIEIIKVEDIPEILKLLVYDYEFSPIMLATVSCMYGTSIPGNLSKCEKNKGK